MKVLVTGATGFIGSYLCELLLSKGLQVYGTVWSQRGIDNIAHIRDRLSLVNCDMKKSAQVIEAVKKVSPDIIFHLAAQAYVLPSWRAPVNTLKTNVLGTVYLLEAVKKFVPASRLIVACSSAAYGPGKTPFRENKPLWPISPYGVSKAVQELLCHQYHVNFGLDIVRARIFSTTGPRKEDDACADFVSQIPAIECGEKPPVLYVGNLDTKRDISDVRDCVKALHLLCEKGKSDAVYNVCSGKSYRMHDIVNKILTMTNKKIEVKVEKSRLRYSDEPEIVGDNTRLRMLGWKPKIRIETTLKDMLEYWRARYSQVRRHKSSDFAGYI